MDRNGQKESVIGAKNAGDYNGNEGLVHDAKREFNAAPYRWLRLPVGSGEWNRRFGIWMVAIQVKISDQIVTGI